MFFFLDKSTICSRPDQSRSLLLKTLQRAQRARVNWQFTKLPEQLRQAVTEQFQLFAKL